MFSLEASKQHGIATEYRVRRLMPVECERLQGYPDHFTAFDGQGKPISDSARYRMLGNSLAVPCVVWIMRRIGRQMGGLTDNDAKENV